MEGDSVEFVKAVKEAGGIEQMATSFLPALAATDKTQYWAAVAPVLQDLCRKFHSEGKKKGDENLQNAALLLSEYIFADEAVALGTKSGFD